MIGREVKNRRIHACEQKQDHFPAEALIPVEVCFFALENPGNPGAIRSRPEIVVRDYSFFFESAFFWSAA
jgi:hypothetical protein